MLDLGKIKQQLYKIKLEDGTVLTLKKPTQATLNKMINLSELNQSEYEEVFIIIFGVLTEIFNRNTQGKIFDREFIESMLDVETAMMILDDYMKDIYKEMGK